MPASIEFPTTRQGLRNLDSPRERSNSTNVSEHERAASTVVGGMLAGLGLSRPGLAGLFLAAVGGALAYRGLTGHCSVYAMAGIDTAH